MLSRGRNNKARTRLTESRVGLLTHGPAVDKNGVTSLTRLLDLDIKVTVVFSPEHGMDGVAQAEEPVGKDDANVGPARLVSLYGKDKESLTPSADDLSDLDVLVIDLVDVGSRYYTYVWTALLAARAAARAGVHTMVLDRPNPLSGNPEHLEGRPQDANLCSFVGLESVPIRHCMTLAEVIVSVLNGEDHPLGPDGVLSVVPSEGWERHRTFRAFARPFVPPSPNMPTGETALVYPGGCLLEGTNLSEGRGTTTPFQLVGAPYLDAEAFVKEVGELSGAWLRPTRFKPSFDKHQGHVCGGLMLHVANEERFRPVESYLRILSAAQRLAPKDFQLLDRVYEFESEHPAFDLLTGTPKAREMLLAGAPVEELIELVCSVDEEWIVRVESAEEMLQEVGFF